MKVVRDGVSCKLSRDKKALLVTISVDLERLASALMIRSGISTDAGLASLAIGGLSRREYEVFRHMIAGLSSKEIASSAAMSERTVKFHLTSIYRKIGVSGRRDLSVFGQVGEKT